MFATNWVREPAFMDFQPLEPKYQNLSEEKSKILTKAVGISGVVMRMTTPHAEPFGFFKLLPNDESDDIFLKVVPYVHFKHFQKVDTIVSSINAFTDTLVNPMLANYPKELSKEAIILGYPFLDGRYTEFTTTDLYKVGYQVANLHNIFRKKELFNVQIINNIRQRSLMRMQSLKKHLSDIITGKVLLSIKSEYLRSVLVNYKGDLEILSDDSSQIIHGDLNYANILFLKSISSPIILDFEDTIASWLNPLTDLAFLIERFAIVISEDNNERLKFATSILNGYLAQSERSISFNKNSLIEYLKVLAIRSLLILSFNEKRGVIVPQSEWNKFYKRYFDVDKIQSLLEKIEKIIE